MGKQRELEFNSLFHLFLSKGSEKVIGVAGSEPQITDDPKSCGLVAFSYYVLANEENQNLEIADDWLERAKSLDSKNNAFTLCAEFFRKKNIEKINDGEISNILEEAKKLEPQNPLVLNLLVEHEYSRGDENGIFLLKQITADWPTYASAWFTLGDYLLESGEYPASIDAFQKAVALRPELSYGWIMLGMCYSRYAEAEMSKARMRYAVEQQRRAYEGIRALGEDEDEDLMEAKDLYRSLQIQARKALNRVLQNEPNQAYALALSGFVEHSLGNSEEAYSLFERSLKIDPNIRQMSDFDKIFVDLRREIELAKMSDVERDLVNRIQKYAIGGKRAYKAQDEKFQYWQNIIHSHFIEQLLPEIRSRKESLVEYWPAYLFWGVKETHKQWGDRIYRHKLGNYGSGYICLTNSAIYLAPIKEISEEFPAVLDGVTGLVYDFLKAAGGDMDSRKLYKKTDTWRITFEEILGSQIGTNDDSQRVIFLNTSSGQAWHIRNFFEGDLTEMQTGIAMAKEGKLLRYLGD